jgi:uncharacterized protein YlxW (UPF0749 family)
MTHERVTPRHSGATTTRPEPPPQAVMGLLNYLTATSMDEDYAVAHRRREAVDAERDPRPGSIAMVIVAVFGLLLATAAVQTSRTADDEQSSHDELVRQINARKEQLANRQQRADELRRQTDDLEAAYRRLTAEGNTLQQRLSRLAVVAGAVDTRGPGVRIVVDDGPTVEGQKNEVLDVDLQQMVNGLWLAGAEAISINRQRLTSLTAIRLAGENITVNFRRVSRPYVVRAIGNPDTLAARFIDTTGGQWWLLLRSKYGLEFRITTVDPQEPLVLPAANRLDLRHARPMETPP